MPAENEFEKSMRQLLDGLQVEPAPSDWQAVYNQLHPPKKRRIIWWWMPLGALLVGIGWWMRNEPAGNGQQAKMTLRQEQAPTLQNSTDEQIGIDTPQAKTATTAKYKPDSEDSFTGSPNHTHQSAASSDHPNVLHATSLTNDNHTFSSSRNNDPVSKVAGTTSTETISGNTASQSAITHHTDGQSGVGNELLRKDSVLTSVTMAAQSTETGAIKVDSAAAATPPGSSKKPLLQKTRTWNWLVYAGAGHNMTGLPVSMNKAAQDYSSGGQVGNSSIQVTNTQLGNGFIAAAGLLAERQWNRNWKFQAGAGFNYSTWSGSSQVFRDSIIQNAGLYSRTLLAQTSSTYQMWMAEIPLQISNRLAGKKQTTWWWTAGINNQLMLGLKQNTSTQALSPNNSRTDTEKSLKGSTRFYQPQFRLGLLLDHHGAHSRWQLSPIFNYGLSPVYKTSADNMNTRNLQLQFRYYLNQR